MAVSKKFGLVLESLTKTGDIDASAIVTRDGVLMGISTNINKPETFAAMSATMLGAAETATAELGKGLPNRVIVESSKSRIIVTGAGPKAILVVLTKPSAGLGLILVELEKAADKVKELLV